MTTTLAPSLPTRNLLAFFFRNCRKILLAFCLPFFLAVALSFLPTPRYKASSVLTVRLGSEFVYQPEVGSSQNNQQQTIPFDRDQIFKSEVAILQSDDLHEQVIKQIGIDNLFPGSEVTDDTEEAQRVLMAKAVLSFDKRFEVNLEKESSVITITYEHKSATMASDVLDTLLKLYMEKRKSLYQESRVDLAKSQAEEAHQRAIAAGKAFEAFKRAHNILSFQEERAALMQQRSDLERQRASISSVDLDSKLAYVEGKLSTLNREEAEFNSLTHDNTVAEDEYAVFAHRLSEASAYEDLERERLGSVRIIQPPSVPPEPKSLQVAIVAMGFVFSLLAAAITAILLDILSADFMTPEQLEKAIGLPVLATISRRKKDPF